MRPSFLDEMRPRLLRSFAARGLEVEGELFVRELETRKARRVGAEGKATLFTDAEAMGKEQG